MIPPKTGPKQFPRAQAPSLFRVSRYQLEGYSHIHKAVPLRSKAEWDNIGENDQAQDHDPGTADPLEHSTNQERRNSRSKTAK